MSWLETQSALAEALRDRDRDVSSVLGPRAGLGSGRFNVYRNNRIVGLRDALGSTFAVTRQLVGDAFFAGMARAFIEEQPPETPVLSAYGGALPEFISRFSPARELPFLADLARLEWLANEAYGAADAANAEIGLLGDVPAERLGDASIVLHPAVRLLRSDWPVFSIWVAHQGGEDANALAAIDWSEEAGAVIRPGLHVDIMRLEPEAFAVAAALQSGASLAGAGAAAGDVGERELGLVLAMLFGAGFVTSVIEGSGSGEDQITTEGKVECI